MNKFLAVPGNKALADRFSGGHHITLVCDKVSLSGQAKLAYQKLVDDGVLSQHTWLVFLQKTVQVHQDFLDVADEERKRVVSIDSKKREAS
jgi:hypothetical protein